MFRFTTYFLFCISLIFGSAEPTSAAKRVALVIGNSAYEHASTLKNPKNDAEAMAKALERFGFEVVTGIDLKHQDFANTISQFRKKLGGADVGLFFYAGHGLQVKGRNYLAPVDAKLDEETSLAFEAVPLQLILSLMENSSKTNLVFLDACRDNPLARNLARSMGTRSNAIGRGLAREETGLGTLISFATQPGNVALDGEGNHSPFATGLLKHIETPGMDVALVLRRVRQDVIDMTSGSQVPWSNSSLTGEFVFNPEIKTAAVSSDDAQNKSDPSSANEPRSQSAWEMFKATERIGTCGAYEAFEKEFPDSFHSKLAHEWQQKNCKPDRKVTNLQRKTDTPERDPQVEPENPRQLALALQEGLNRVGCSAGSPDGDWGPRSRQALGQFNIHAKASLPTAQPTAEALKAVSGKTGRVCPVAQPPQNAVTANQKPTQEKKPTPSAKKPARTASGGKVCNDLCMKRRMCTPGSGFSHYCDWAKKRVKEGKPVCRSCSNLLGPKEVYRPGVN